MSYDAIPDEREQGKSHESLTNRMSVVHKFLRFSESFSRGNYQQQNMCQDSCSTAYGAMFDAEKAKNSHQVILETSKIGYL